MLLSRVINRVIADSVPNYRVEPKNYRNRIMMLLTHRAGLRWRHVTTSDGQVKDEIRLASENFVQPFRSQSI